MLKKFDKNDLAFMSSLSEAVLRQSERKSKLLLNIIIAVMLFLIVWSSYAEIDEITRGEGRVIPSSKIQVIQNLEGGIISEILIDAGDIVKKGQPLLKIVNKKEESTYEENKLKINELQAKVVRLYAEANEKEFAPDAELEKKIPELIKNEKNLYVAHMKHLQNQLQMIEDQISQKKSELNEAIAQARTHKKSLDLIEQEIEITKPLVKKGIESKRDYLKLEREHNDIVSAIENDKLMIPRLELIVQEYEKKKKDIRLTFKNKAKLEWNEVTAEIERISQKKEAYADQVGRTLVRSPVHGTVKQLFVNTIGGVVKPGMDLIEIVPIDDNLIIETKIKPSDVAFLYPDQPAIVKFTAYDFSIYGGLEGRVINISADTIKDEDKKNYYLIRIKTDKNYIGYDDKKLSIIPGMTVTVDILTGKKTIMGYLLKPILKAKQNALTER